MILDQMNTQPNPYNGLGEGNRVVNSSPSEVLVDPDLVGISLGLKLWDQLTAQNNLPQPGFGRCVPLLGRTPLNQQHTDLCIDYCCSGLLQVQSLYSNLVISWQTA